MSADNWGQCPKCTKIQDKETKQKEEQVKEAYGNVSAETYLNLLAALKAEEETPDTRSMREDWDLGVYEDGEFCLDYRASCVQCGFKYAFSYTADTLKEPPATKE